MGLYYRLLYYISNNHFTDIENGVEESRKGEPHGFLLMKGLHELAMARTHMIRKDSQTGNVSKVSLDSALLHGVKAVEELNTANQYPHYLYRHKFSRRSISSRTKRRRRKRF